jgi:hypothetical protein
MSTLTSLAVVCLILLGKLTNIRKQIFKINIYSLAWNQLTDGLACYSCTNCNDPFNQNYIQIAYSNDTIPWYCSVSW